MGEHSGLLTDLYELTMAAGYVESGLQARATFELFVREMPPRRNFLVAAGLEQAIEFIEKIHFSSEDILFLRRHAAFAHISDKFFDYLARFRFSGEVWAVPEGRVVFPEEPLLRVTSPIAEAQILETCLLSSIGFQTLIASKAARVTTAARGRRVVEFGTRRAHGIESGVLAARAACIGGCCGTSNVSAGRRFGLETYGTQAHSWIMAHENEEQAFRSFHEHFPDHAVLLLDTYDVRAAVETILRIGRKPRGVRLDSGDLVADSQWVRRRLDAHGWNDVEIFASGDLSEERIAGLLERGAEIGGFGVGTSLATSADAPALGVIYKLVEVEHPRGVRGAAKLSSAKATFPGRKQVYRFRDPAGRLERDVIALESEEFPGGEPLLEPVILGGKRLAPPVAVPRIREKCLEELRRLPPRLLELAPVEPFRVERSPRLLELLEETRRALELAHAQGSGGTGR